MILRYSFVLVQVNTGSEALIMTNVLRKKAPMRHYRLELAGIETLYLHILNVIKTLASTLPAIPRRAENGAQTAEIERRELNGGRGGVFSCF
jgi:hypothetical protein